MTERNPDEVVIPRKLALTLLKLLGDVDSPSVQDFKQLVHQGWNYVVEADDTNDTWTLFRRPQHGTPVTEWIADFRDKGLAEMVKRSLEAERDAPVADTLSEVTMPRKVAAKMRDLALDMGTVLKETREGTSYPAYVTDGASLPDRRFREFVKYI